MLELTEAEMLIYRILRHRAGDTYEELERTTEIGDIDCVSCK